MNPGTEFTLLPQKITGKDGVEYNVITMYASGRGWANRIYVALIDPKTITARALEPEHYQHVPGIMRLELLSGEDQKIQMFSKNPYVRKDGSFKVLSGYDEKLNEVYGMRFPHMNIGYFVVKKCQIG